MKSSEPEDKVQRKVKGKSSGMSENYLGIMMRIISGNYPLVYNITWLSHGKVEIYRDTGVSKNVKYAYKILYYVKNGEENKKIEQYQRRCFVIHQKKILTRK